MNSGLLSEIVKSRSTMIVTDVAHVGSISNIHINAARTKMATVLCSMIDNSGVPFSARPKNDRGTNQKNRKAAKARQSITAFLAGNPAVLTVSVDMFYQN